MADTPYNPDRDRQLIPHHLRTVLAAACYSVMNIDNARTHVGEAREVLAMNARKVPVWVDELTPEQCTILHEFVESNKIPEGFKRLSHAVRAVIAQNYFDWVVVLSAHEEDQVIEANAMDAMGVPMFEHQLNKTQREYLALNPLVEMGSEPIKKILAAPAPLESPEAVVKKMAEALTTDQLDDLIGILNLRRSAVSHNAQNEPGKKYELLTWEPDEQGFISDEPTVVSSHATPDEADLAMERFNARQVFADILLFQKDLKEGGRDAQ